MHRHGVIAAALAALSLVLSMTVPVLAGRDNDNKKHGHGHDDDRAPPPVVIHQAPVVFGGGPPPWAPAHGYRRKQGREEVYVAPYGIDSGRCYREQIGQAVGGVTGAVIGSQVGKGTGRVVAAAGGTLLGVLIGGAIGRSLDQADYMCAGQILEHAPDHRTIVWRNPETGGAYRMTPTNAYQVDGRYCREYTSTATIAGRSQQIYGTACRQPDGSWQIVGP